MSNARQIALAIIQSVNEEGAYTNVAMDKILRKQPLNDRRDQALVNELVTGTIKNQIRLDFILQHFSREPLARLSPWVRNILRMSLYQLLFLDKIPESAAVNEGVNLTKKYSHAGSVKFVNGVLRNVIRKRGEIPFPRKEEDVSSYLSIQYSFPLWLVNFFIEHHGVEETENMLAFFNQQPPLWIRRNPLKVTAAQLEETLKEKEISFEKSHYIPEAYCLLDRIQAMKMEEYANGWFSLQDETSMYAVDMLDPQPGEAVLDMCSAPGGKTTFIAERMGDTGRLVAVELYDHRIKTVKEQCNRLGIQMVEALVGDARDIHRDYPEAFDRILLDAPCSGLGVIGKRPDLRYHASHCRFEEIQQIQKELLDSAALALKPGGVLVYATCTLQTGENQEMVASFLENHPDFSRETTEKYQSFAEKTGDILVLPYRDQKNGFFVTRLRKRR